MPRVLNPRILLISSITDDTDAP